jgi:hypothetical protein
MLVTAGYFFQSNELEGQITYYSHSNSKPVENAENMLLGE